MSTWHFDCYAYGGIVHVVVRFDAASWRDARNALAFNMLASDFHEWAQQPDIRSRCMLTYVNPESENAI